MKILSILFLILIYQFGICQKATISGFVTDSETGEKLVGAMIYEQKTKTGTTSNNFGFYSFSLQSADSLLIEISYVGYEKQSVLITKNSEKQINFSLTLNNELSEVLISQSHSIVKSNDISILQIPISQIKNLPSLAGEADILKAFHLMPGVQAGAEGTSGLYVRGGSPDQNLILLDGVPLYYVNHIGGFISVFAPGSINSVKLYKGGFPARFGGRLSSVIDITMKDGNFKKRAGEISLGVISSGLSFETPIKKDKSSFFISLRRCNLDLFTRLAQKLTKPQDFSTGYTFYDLNSKLNFKLNEKNSVFLSFYHGRDRIFLKDKSTSTFDNATYKIESNIKWGNILTAARWNHIFKSTVFSNLTIYYTKFYYLTDVNNSKTDNDNSSNSETERNLFKSQVNDVSAKYEIEWFPNNQHEIRTGIFYIRHSFVPGYISYKLDLPGQNKDTTLNSQKLSADESCFYIEDDFHFNKKTSMNIGIHSSLYSVENKTFFSVQPRIVVNRELSQYMSLKASYSTMNQYVHLLSNSSAGLPNDLWVPSTTKIHPEFSQQIVAGLFYTIPKYSLDISFEVFYKKMNNLIEFKEGTSIFSGTSDWQSKVETNGSGNVKGLELLIQKQVGRYSGWIGYTLSKNTRQFEKLNNGKEFPYKYDRTHDFSIVFNLKIKKNIQFSATWVYSTGSATTLAVSKYPLINTDYYFSQMTFDDAHLYNGKNQFRLPAYHRLDIGFTSEKKLTKGTRIWNLSVYNLYNRMNPFILYFGTNNNQNRKLYQITLFPVIFSFNYSFLF
jgi:outer membrane cobalamin receptor